MNPGYLRLLRDAADQVESWLADLRVLEVFRKRIRPAANWYIKVHKVQEANKRRIEDEDLRAAMIDPRRRNKARSPGQDYEWVSWSPIPGHPLTKQDFQFMREKLGFRGTSWDVARKASDDGRFGYWRRKTPPVCDAAPWLGVRIVAGEMLLGAWQDRAEALSAYYCFLAAIHDCDCVAFALITHDVWPRELLEYVRWHFRRSYGDKAKVIGIALDWVRWDLDAEIGRTDAARTSAESKPGQMPSTRAQAGELPMKEITLGYGTQSVKRRDKAGKDANRIIGDTLSVWGFTLNWRNAILWFRGVSRRRKLMIVVVGLLILVACSVLEGIRRLG